MRYVSTDLFATSSLEAGVASGRLVNKVGPWVVEDAFFGRDHDRRRLAGLLTDGMHVSLTAQRRVGKTSLLRQVALDLKTSLTCLYVDLQNATDAVDAIVQIALATRSHDSIWSRVAQGFTNVLGRVDEVGLGLDGVSLKLREGALGDWRAKGSRIAADLAATDRPMALMLDELPVLLVKLLRRDRAEAETFLGWLRWVCLAHTATLRVVVTGSIGLAPIAHRAGLSGMLNHFTPLHLDAWDAATTLSALKALAKHANVTWVAGADEQVVEELGCCIPYHVQLFFQLLRDDARKNQTTEIGRPRVQHVYRHRLLSSHGHAELAHMEERLRDAVDSGHVLATELLTEAAVSGGVDPDGRASTGYRHRPGWGRPQRCPPRRARGT